MPEELVEYLAAELDPRAADDTSQEAVVGELLGKREGARLDLTLDVFEALPGAS